MKNKSLVEKNKKISPFFIICGVILAIYTLILLALLIWGFITSFKDFYLDFYFNPAGLPKEWKISNYTDVLEKGFNTRVMDVNKKFHTYHFIDLIKHSIFYALGCSFFSTLIPCITGYAMARFKFKFSNVLYYVVLFTMALPVVGNLASEINVARTLGLYDTFPGMWIMSANFAGQYTLVFFATFKCIPNGYSEAAELDGASEFSIMVKIVMPLIIKTFGAVMLIKFISYWNEYESAMIYLKSHPTLAYGVFNLNAKTDQPFDQVTLKIAGCMILAVPILIVFVLFQNKLMGNVSMGGIKG